MRVVRRARRQRLGDRARVLAGDQRRGVARPRRAHLGDERDGPAAQVAAEARGAAARSRPASAAPARRSSSRLPRTSARDLVAGVDDARPRRAPRAPPCAGSPRGRPRPRQRRCCARRARARSRSASPVATSIWTRRASGPRGDPPRPPAASRVERDLVGRGGGETAGRQHDRHRPAGLLGGQLRDPLAGPRRRAARRSILAWRSRISPRCRSPASAPSEHRQVSLELPTGDLDAVLLPLLALELDVALEDVVAERLAARARIRPAPRSPHRASRGAARSRASTRSSCERS